MRFRKLRDVLCVSAVMAVFHVTVTASADSWMAQIGGLGPEVVFDLVETSDRRLCATGTFTNDAQFGADERLVTLHADAIQDIYVACFSADGTLETAVQFGADISDQPRAIAAFPDGDILVTGYFLNSLGPGKSGSLQSSGSADIFLIRMNKKGEEVWSRKFGGSFADNGNALAITPGGEILLAGNFQETITYESAGATREIISAGGRDAFVFRLDGNGNIQWAQSFGGKGRDEASRVVAGADGSIYIAGTFEDTALVGRRTGKMTATHGADGFLIAFDADGTLRWTRQLAGSNRDYVSGLVSDEQGALYLSGNFLDEIELPNQSTLRSAGSADVFLLKFDSQGRQLWQRRIGGEQVDESFDLAITTSGELLLSGHFQGDVEISIADEARVLKSHGVGNPDGFVLTFDMQGEYKEVMTAAGDGVETVFAVAALQGGGMATAGFFNKEVTLQIDGLGKLEKRGKTDVFLVRVAARQFRTSATPGIHLGRRTAGN
ncbi:MAG: hypothetical protein WBN32_07995 [Woeseia sp.]